MYNGYRMVAVRSFDGLESMYYSEEIMKELSKMGARMVVRFEVREYDLCLLLQERKNIQLLQAAPV